MSQIDVAIPIVGEEEVQAVREVLLSGNYVSGPKVKEFEDAFAEYVGTSHAVAVSNGTAAIQVALACYGIGPGDEVVVPSMTFFSTATAVMHQNAVPIFCDVDGDYCMDPASFESVITPRTKAVIPVHLYGYPANMDEILAVANAKGLVVIEDCAQAHGAAIRGTRVGALGHVGAFSFFATKNMTTGEGGMITTNDAEVARMARLIRSHGMANRDDHVVLGYNHRMTEMEAAMGLVQLGKLEGMNAVRRAHSERILRSLADLEWLHVQSFAPDRTHAYFWCPVRYLPEAAGEAVAAFKEHLAENGIGFRHRYEEPLYRQKMLLEGQGYPRECPTRCPHYLGRVDYSAVHFPNAAAFSGNLLGLPNHPGLSENDVDRVVDVVRSFR